jgi:hypothetical protein
MIRLTFFLFATSLILAVRAQSPSPYSRQHRPLFEDFPVTDKWDGVRAPLQLVLPAERMFKTRLTEAASKPPNFAGHYSIAIWGCGSNCGAGAIIDLQSGKVFQPPTAPGQRGWERWIISSGFFGDDADVYFRPGSRLLIIRAIFHSESPPDLSVGDTLYSVWNGTGFEEVLKVLNDRTRLPEGVRNPRSVE